MAGAPRRDELNKMTLDNIEEKEDILLTKIPDIKTNKPRSFVVTKLLESYRKYINLRRPQTPHRSFLQKQ